MNRTQLESAWRAPQGEQKVLQAQLNESFDDIIEQSASHSERSSPGTNMARIFHFVSLTETSRIGE
ncbi:hypothetical protein DVJ77_16955 [Dyella tabacisoli]|uniref:Uncharacterized protein n=1 Tax=Dyella tabacisoli TaxID=2282381 RepID=A0A369UKC2_9GAMM|nr:hypothetical protein DVJ77_16955 [Dyella tabacisoli]